LAFGVRRREEWGYEAALQVSYGDFQDVHRCAVLSAESRAGQYGHHDIELAAAHLHGMLEQAR
jgi:hypothetical protein